MKEIIDVPGFDDVIIYSEYDPQLERHETGKIITKTGEVCPHKKTAKKVSFYYPKFNMEGYRIGVDVLSIDVTCLKKLIEKLTSISNEPAIDAEYQSDDLPF